MAAYSAVRAVHKTLSTTVADAVTLTGTFDLVEISNRSGSANLYVTTDGTTPVSAANDTDFVAAGTSLQIRPLVRTPSGVVIGVVGSANDYSVAAVQE